MSNRDQINNLTFQYQAAMRVGDSKAARAVANEIVRVVSMDPPPPLEPPTSVEAGWRACEECSGSGEVRCDSGSPYEGRGPGACSECRGSGRLRDLDHPRWWCTVPGCLGVAKGEGWGPCLRCATMAAILAPALALGQAARPVSHP